MLDTSPEAARIQAAVHRKLGAARRFEIACEMSDAVRSITRGRIEAKHPEYDEVAVQDEFLWELYGFRRQR